MQFLLQDKGKVVMFTSTKSGEGKTFVSSNFAISQAVLGKKVLLMGLDIRRPRLADVFNITRKKPGITSYLMGSAENTEILDTLIVPSGVVDSLDLLPAGIVPPNPAELLAKNNLAVAIEYLSKKYDYIIMDTAPVGLVSDSILIGKLVDTVVFVARNEYTEKSDIQFLNSLVESGKMESLSIVFNAESVSSIQLSRRGKYRYGYSYYGYSDEPNKQ
ncbi:MAG: CpsD/CapB family tyrosine-protein kinase [Bacteroidaceae bacterium]|nr:CpsD/CapB family tyrosine-protein kinase [Bacteroidaceae bacterium]